MTDRGTRADYKRFRPIQTRWMDNDVYGHVNNVIYYSYFDTIVNGFLVDAGVLDFHSGAVIGLVVETSCRYYAPIEFPDALEGALRVAHLGNSSVRYEIAIFRAGEDAPVAEGHFVHVYVDRENRRPQPLPPDLRATLEAVKA
ncbi:MAG: thioesterase family protein [Pseudomonadota bacterium]